MSEKRTLPPLPRVMLEPLVRAALLEDLGRAGDITSDSIIPHDVMARTALVARQPGVVAGLDIAALAFALIDPAITMERHVHDGAAVVPGQVLATVSGPGRGILTAERTALNFLCHLSGVATGTASIVASIAGSKAHVVCTRKTMPGLRSVEKYAVRAGGGSNHRFGLDDAVLIKDNHIAIAGSIQTAVARARSGTGHMVKIEVEVDTLAQLEEVMRLGIDAVLLDNMGPAMLRDAVAFIDGRAIAEASGRITPQTAPLIAEAGVDLISVGWLTHSVSVLDIGMDYQAIMP